MILPGGTLGILGGGQLGRMLCLEARRMGYRTVVWSGTEVAEPTQGVADELILKPFNDVEAFVRFVSLADVATVEFENIDHEVLREVEQAVGLFPQPQAVAICQNREREKLFLQGQGIPCAPFRVVESAAELAEGVKALGGRTVLKTASFGYDGKGQVKVSEGEDCEAIWSAFEAPRGVLEKWIPFDCEISVMVARNEKGELACYDPAENIHRHHILDTSIVPARIAPERLEAAKKIATDLVEQLQYVGLIGVEFFVTQEGELLVNEMAPRPHNSGHHTMDACETSQFEQQLRAVTGLPLGSTRLLAPVVMLNLLGDLWSSDGFLSSLVAQERAYWHFYGKSGSAGFRKCGHLNFLGEDALSRATSFKETLLSSSTEESGD